LGVLDRQLVQVKPLRDLLKFGAAGLEEAQPDEVPTLACGALGGLLDRQLALVLTLAVFVVGAVDDHRAFLAGFRFRLRGEPPSEAVLGSATARKEQVKWPKRPRARASSPPRTTRSASG